MEKEKFKKPLKLMTVDKKRAFFSKREAAVERAEKEISLYHFRELLRTFKEAGKNGEIDLDSFKTAFRNIFNASDDQLEQIFMKIDSDADNLIDSEDFTSFMLLRSEGQKSMLDEAQSRLFDLDAAVVTTTPHKDFINRILYLKQYKKYVTCSRDGVVAMWSENFRLQRTYDSIISSSRKQSPKKQSPVWLNDICHLPNLGKVAVSSDEHEIVILDFMSMQPSCKLDLHDFNCLSLEFIHYEDQYLNQNVFVIGGDQGNVNFLIFNPESLFDTITKNKYRIFNIESLSEQNKDCLYIKKAVHKAWTRQVAYVPELRGILSCSDDENTALALIPINISEKSENFVRHRDVCVVPVHKGVNTFAFCKHPLSLITGGTDHILRIWNPHVLDKPTSCLKGHSTPIDKIVMDTAHGYIISMSMDKAIKIWDIRTQTCVQSIQDGYAHKPENTLSTCFFNNENGEKLMVASNTIISYSIKKRTAVAKERTHDHVIRGIVYNPLFSQVITGCEGSVVNVWDPFIGRKTFRYVDAHGKSEITAMTLDVSNRRLVTASRNGEIKIWNPNDGRCLQELIKPSNAEVTDLLCVDARDSKFIVAVGWDRCLTLFPDDQSVTEKTYPIQRFEKIQSSDTLCVAFQPPNILALGSYDGEIALVNMYTGTVIKKLTSSMHDFLYEDARSIDKLLFIRSSGVLVYTSDLVSCGGDGMIRFWNTSTGSIMYELKPSSEGASITAITTDSKKSLLIASDNQGMVYVYDITHISMQSGPEASLICSWRAHVSGVTSLAYMEEREVVVTGSVDCSVRLWELDGAFIGILGAQKWDLENGGGVAGAMPEDVSEIEGFHITIKPVEEDEVLTTFKMEEEKDGLKTARIMDLPCSPFDMASSFSSSLNEAKKERVKTADYISGRYYTSAYANTQYARNTFFRDRSLPLKQKPKFTFSAKDSEEVSSSNEDTSSPQKTTNDTAAVLVQADSLYRHLPAYDLKETTNIKQIQELLQTKESMTAFKRAQHYMAIEKAHRMPQ